ncbi:hypothetical protein NUU61_007010, partial [Penicillium alfredii]
GQFTAPILGPYYVIRYRHYLKYYRDRPLVNIYFTEQAVSYSRLVSLYRENQLSLIDYKIVISNVAANKSYYIFTSQRDYNILRDQSLSYNPSTPILARDKTEPANQRLFRYSSKTDAEPGKSSPIPVIETHSIQSQATDPIATYNGYSETQSDSSEADLIVY